MSVGSARENVTIEKTGLIDDKTFKPGFSAYQRPE
jgi:hypothetical protein